jgi:radical SAM superfamily enzyme YgiQ (UPF0313 family)
MASPRTTVALVGRRLPHNENLGLCYLRAALQRAGVEVSVHYVNDTRELALALRALLAAPPHVIGLSLADGGSALLPLALGEAMHRAGYRGHVTSGGQFATLARGWLLERYAWLDSVVRFAGEVPLVALAERVARGEPAFGVPGVTTRAGDGPPAPVLDPAPLDLVPVRDELPEILGHRAAHLSASRGCAGRCGYCGPAALQTQERAEGERAGVRRVALTAAGVGGVRRRALDGVCAEMASLYHERGVRYFYFVDEHLLPYDEAEALAYLAALREGLRARGVGPIGMGCMLRADRLTPAIVRAFAEAGLVRAFVGLEIAGEDEARRFGRPAPTEREIDLLRVFAEHGVTTVSNLMLVHPYATPASITAGIDLLERIPAGVFEATRMMAYHGTKLALRLAEEGRLVGNPLRHGYTFADPAMERFAEIFTRLRGEAFHDYSMAYRTHDALLGLSLARRLYPERVRPGLLDRLDAVRRRVQRLYVDAYRRGLALAQAGGGFAEAGDLVRGASRSADELERELGRLEESVLAAAPPRAALLTPMRAAAASIFTFALAACPSSVESNPGGSGTTSGTGTTSTTTSTGCEPSGPLTSDQVAAILNQGAACFSGYVSPPSQPGDPIIASAYAGVSSYPGLGACSTPGAQAALDAQANAARAALASACVGADALPVGGTSVSGGSMTDMQAMYDAIEASCQALWDPNSFPQFDIKLDASGKVVGVTGDAGIQPLLDCIQAALVNLSFPCLASFDVCPEYAIAE